MTIRELRCDRLAAERLLPPELTVLLIHHAGGSAAAYLPLVRHLPRRWRLLGLELPARLPSAPQPACRTMGEAVEWMLDTVRDETSGPGPFAVFGHSMGALLAYELVRALEAQERMPVWLGLSASAAPHLLAGPGGRRQYWPQSRSQTWSQGWPYEQEHMAERMACCLRNDLALIEGYRHRAGPPLSTPVSVYSGSADPVVGDRQLEPWIEYAGGQVAFHSWPGGHFYLFERAAEVCARMVHDIRAAMVRRARAAR